MNRENCSALILFLSRAYVLLPPESPKPCLNFQNRTTMGANTTGEQTIYSTVQSPMVTRQNGTCNATTPTVQL